MLRDSSQQHKGRLRMVAFVLSMMLSIVLSIMGISCSSDEPTEFSVASRPNVLLVVMDTTRAQSVSAYGHKKQTTPHFDRLAAEGALFSRAMSTDFWTLPTHASLLTGLYPSDHGATSETNALPVRAETLAERLKEEGYSTGAFVTNTWVSAERGFDRGFDEFYEAWRNSGSTGAPILDGRTLRKAIAWIDEQNREERPFFAMLNLNGAHMPYTPESKVLASLSPGLERSEQGERTRRIAGMWKYLAGDLELDSEDFESMKARYEAEIYIVDRLIGELIQSLTDLGIYDDTLVILTADHGENVGEHDRIDHLFSMHETTIHIPLAIRFPSRFSAGRIDERLASQVDVMPTVLDVLGLANGSSEILEHSLANPEREAPKFVVAENDRPINGIKLMMKQYPEFDTAKIDHKMRMLRTDRFKLIWRSNGEVALFDLETDPFEEDDVSNSHPEILRDLLAQLEEWMLDRGDEGAISFETTDPDALEQLKALGYIE